MRGCYRLAALAGPKISLRRTLAEITKRLSSQDFPHHVSMHIREPERATVERVSQAFVV